MRRGRRPLALISTKNIFFAIINIIRIFFTVVAGCHGNSSEEGYKMHSEGWEKGMLERKYFHGISLV